MTTPVATTPAQKIVLPSGQVTNEQVSPTRSILVMLKNRVPMNDIARMPRGPERKTAAWNRLVANAAESQRGVIELAEQLKAEGKVAGYESLVSPNAVAIQLKNTRDQKAVAAAVQALAGVESVFGAATGKRIEQAPADHGRDHAAVGVMGLDVVPESAREVDLPNATAADPDKPLDELEPAWGVAMLGAPEAWKQGATGKGLVYGSIDTGVDVEHEALKHAYRGYDAETQSMNHDYSWFDASMRPSEAPRDTHGHGTHTIGTVLGRNSEHVFGVAPEAKFIAAMGLSDSQTMGIMRSLQFMQAPTKVDGSAPDPSKAPDVVGMSFWNGQSHDNLYQPVMKNLVTAGIEPVKSTGNGGPGPETGTSPGQLDEVTGIAAVDEQGEIAKFSSRGPSPLEHVGRKPLWKPDFAAPGVNVLSAVPGNRYSTMSGTSMAQPHASGAILSILSKYPNLSQDKLRKALAAGAQDAGAKGRDLEFGHGIINLPGALAQAKAELGGPIPASEVGTPADPVPSSR